MEIKEYFFNMISKSTSIKTTGLLIWNTRKKSVLHIILYKRDFTVDSSRYEDRDRKKLWKDINSCLCLGNRIMDAFFSFYTNFLNVNATANIKSQQR